jgi:hypothetical protein
MNWVEIGLNHIRPNQEQQKITLGYFYNSECPFFAEYFLLSIHELLYKIVKAIFFS